MMIRRLTASVFVCLLFHFLYSSYLYACDQPLKTLSSGSVSLDEQLAGKILKKAGCEVILVDLQHFTTLERRIALLVEGEIDIIAAVNRRPEREDIANFSIPFSEERIRLWALKDRAEELANKSLESIIKEGMRVLGPGAGWFGETFEALKQSGSNQLIRYTHVPNGARLLSRNRGDVMIGSEEFDSYIQKELASQIVMLPQIVHRDGYHFMFSKKTVSDATIDSINEAIRKTLADLPND